MNSLTSLCVMVYKTKINVAKEIGRDYHHFGVLLLKDATGAGISAMEQAHRGRPIGISLDWSGYEGEGDLHVTWNDLIEVTWNDLIEMPLSAVLRWHFYPSHPSH